MNNGNEIICGIYLRVSTEDQAREGFSLGEQKERLEAFCKFHGYKIYDYYEDAGISAKKGNKRPNFERLIKDAKSGKLNTILALKLDRISRSVYDWENIMNMCEENNINLICANDDINTTTANGKMITRIMMSVSQNEIERTSERTKIGMAGAIKKGHIPNKAPLGFTRDGKRLVPDPLTKNIAKRIFELYHNGYSYFKIANIYNKEKVLNKTNWSDVTILQIISNEIYKGDYVHGKITKTPKYYEDVVEPIVSKELWEECQVQKKRNSRSYKRSLSYVYLQKLKCPNCNRIMGGKATTKKSGKSYFYYQCHECKFHINEKVIDEHMEEFITEILEYDKIVNQFFLPMLKSKTNNSKEAIKTSIKEQKQMLTRIKQAYAKGTFTLDEYDEEKVYIEKNIKDLEKQLEEAKGYEETTLTAKDVLLKRDIDNITKEVLPKEYREKNKLWKDFTRYEKSEIMMRYVDEIELEKKGSKCVVSFVRFRSSITNTMDELYDSGNIDRKDQAVLDLGRIGLVIPLRYSEYRDYKDVAKHVFRLRQFYKVDYYEANYIVKDAMLNFNISKDRHIVRVFPLEKVKEEDLKNKETIQMGVLFIKPDKDILRVDEETVFNSLPPEVDYLEYEYNKETKQYEVVRSKPLIDVSKIYENDTMLKEE